MGARGEGDDRGWDGWMVSLTQWTWVWVNSGSWWGTRRPGVLWFMGSQRVGHDWATGTELNWGRAERPRGGRCSGPGERTVGLSWGWGHLGVNAALHDGPENITEPKCPIHKRILCNLNRLQIHQCSQLLILWAMEPYVRLNKAASYSDEIK